jgi:predicted ATPase/DNA-binding winged helix-turn-helix (wHTH) protein
MSSDADTALRFGPFTLHRARKLLLEGERPLRVGGRGLELLGALVERAGEVLSHQQLSARVWPDVVVESSSLRVHVAALRTLLGEGECGRRYIVNVPGRGYCFIAPVERLSPPVPAVTAPSPQHNLPNQLTRLLGRAEMVATVAGQLPRRRFITLVAAAGMGKTSVALTAAEQLLPDYAQGVCFVDLARISDPTHVAGALAAALDTTTSEADPIAGLIKCLAPRSTLLLLDNCEHVIEATARLAVCLLKGAPQLHILATSREPLRAEGEWVLRLAALSVPAAEPRPSAAEAGRHAAVQLFVERAIASVDGFELSDANAPAVAEICRRLDGMPLAIELAAARIQAFGAQGLLHALDDRLHLLLDGQRTALPRHRTLQALLDWSHGTLGETEQIVLRRMAVFRASFRLEAAQAVLADEGTTAGQVLEALISLVSKSLLSAEVGASSVQYRLLDTTRAYAAQKLDASGESPAVLRRLAGQLCKQLTEAEAEVSSLTRREWLGAHAPLLDDLRAALNWAQGPQGDGHLGARLTAAAIPLFCQLALTEEFSAYVQQALDGLARLEVNDALLEMRLQLAFTALPGLSPPTLLDKALRRARQLSETPAMAPHQTELLYTWWTGAFSSGDYPLATRLAEQLAQRAQATQDPLGLRVADRVLAQTRHFSGDHRNARQLAERVLSQAGRTLRLALAPTPPVDSRVSMRIVIARVLWIEGFTEQAARVAAESVALAEDDVPYALCQALSMAACPIALWSGQEAQALAYVQRLAEHAAKLDLPWWRSWADNFGQLSGAMPPQISASDGMQADLFATFTPACINPATLQRAEQGVAGWCAAEVLRAHGEQRLAREGPAAAPAAELLFLKSLQLARSQGALSWELRAATSLARLWQTQQRQTEARTLLAPCHARFTEGLDGADQGHARQLLARL